MLLHDARRHGEQATLDMLISRGMKVIHVPTEKGLAIVIDPARRPELLRALDSHHRVKYRGGRSGRWFTDDFHLWSVMFYERDLAQRVLEIGVTDGVSGNLLLDEVFPHPESVCYGIQSYRGEAGMELKRQYFWNVRSGGNAARLHLREGESVVQLSAMVHQGYGQDFDFIHHSGNARPADFLTELCLGWELLKDGGIMVIRRDKDLEHGMQSFLSAYQSRHERLLSGACEVLVKQS
jgi:Methyltransferase domain